MKKQTEQEMWDTLLGEFDEVKNKVYDINREFCLSISRDPTIHYDFYFPLDILVDDITNVCTTDIKKQVKEATKIIDKCFKRNQKIIIALDEISKRKKRITNSDRIIKRSCKIYETAKRMDKRNITGRRQRTLRWFDCGYLRRLQKHKKPNRILKS